MSTTTHSAAAPVEAQYGWAFQKVPFPPFSEARCADRPIVIVDVGDGHGGFNHPLLNRRVTYVKRTHLDPDEVLHGAHAAEIAGVIAKVSPASLVVFDIGTIRRWDKDLFVLALRDAIAMNPKPAVINISVAWDESSETWPDAADAIQDCIKAGITIVAAMGDTAAHKHVVDTAHDRACKDPAAMSDTPARKDNKWYPPDWFPANQPGVIAVAGIDVNDLRLPDSDTGEHVWIAAPGDDIVTVVSERNLGTRKGTSFAAALVAAAVWWAKCEHSELSPADIKDLLCQTADGHAVGLDSPKSVGRKHGRPWDSNIGCGRLDVMKLLERVKKLSKHFSDSSAVRLPHTESTVNARGTVDKEQPVG